MCEQQRQHYRDECSCISVIDLTATPKSDPLVLIPGTCISGARHAVVGASEATEHGAHHRPSDGGAHTKGKALGDGSS